jgi:hypothetical protein
VLLVHAPGDELQRGTSGALAIDLPGHGLSDGWPGKPPTDWAAWQQVIDAVTGQFGLTEIRLPDIAPGDAERLFPDLSPDRYGAHLIRAWQIVRARHFFAPHYSVGAANAIAFDPEHVRPESLARQHRALLRASAGRAYHHAITNR